jgi:ornithine carbamoyltransferase
VETAVQNCKKSKGSITLTHNLNQAVANADVIYTDTWASMGQEKETKTREKIFSPFQVNRALVQKAKPGCLVSHCLPAHRGKEITDEVLESSMAFDEAENRLHVQKAILLTLLGKKG